MYVCSCVSVEGTKAMRAHCTILCTKSIARFPMSGALTLCVSCKYNRNRFAAMKHAHMCSCMRPIQYTLPIKFIHALYVWRSNNCASNFEC